MLMFGLKSPLFRLLIGSSLLLMCAFLLPQAVADEAQPPAEATEPHTEGDHHGAHETGVPGWKTDLALWSLVTFVCFLFVLKKAAWGPLIEGLDKRESGIRAAIAQAEENQRKAHARLAEYDEKLRHAEKTVADMFADAKRDAERNSQDIVAKAQANVEAMRVRAKDDISQARNMALTEVFASINSQVAAATERVLGRSLTSEDQDRLIDEALAEIRS